MTEKKRPRIPSLLDDDGPFGLSAMPVQAKAVKSAIAHLERDHRVDPSVTSGDAGRLMQLHFIAHGFDSIPSYPPGHCPGRSDLFHTECSRGRRWGPPLLVGRAW